MTILKSILPIALSYSSGLVISVSFISLVISVGLLNNLIEKFEIVQYKNYLVFFLATGMIIGSILSFYPNQTLMLNTFNIGKIICTIVGLFYGIFVGYLAISLTEVFDVIPIINNKVGFRFNIKLLIVSVAVGKLLGSLVYYLGPSFYTYR